MERKKVLYDYLVRQGGGNVKDSFYEAERNRIDLLNREFFQDVELTKAENAVLVQVCGWDEWTINAIISVFRKVEELK